jgi:hypothetical protein
LKSNSLDQEVNFFNKQDLLVVHSSHNTHIEKLFYSFLLVILLLFLLSLALNCFFSFHIKFLGVHHYLKQGLGANIVVNLEVGDSELSVSLSLNFNDNKLDVLKVQERELFPS